MPNVHGGVVMVKIGVITEVMTEDIFRKRKEAYEAQCDYIRREVDARFPKFSKWLAKYNTEPPIEVLAELLQNW
jgi:hypothetical protein